MISFSNLESGNGPFEGNTMDRQADYMLIHFLPLAK